MLAAKKKQRKFRTLGLYRQNHSSNDAPDQQQWISTADVNGRDQKEARNNGDMNQRQRLEYPGSGTGKFATNDGHGNDSGIVTPF